MKTFCSTIVIAISLLVCTNGLLNGQNKIDGYYLNAKLGINNNWLGGGGEINILRRHFIYSLGIYEFWNFNSTANIWSFPIDFLIGKYVGDRYLRFQYQGGLGLFWGGKNAGNKWDNGTVSFATLGIPLKLGFKILPSRFISIGMDLQANLNFEKSIVIPMFSIEIGKLRNKIVKRN
jgi:hypothetical protein